MVIFQTPPNAMLTSRSSWMSSPKYTYPTLDHVPDVHAMGLLLSSSGMRIYASIAAEKTANPAHPTAAACGPAFLANIPPVKHPPATPFHRSFLALRPSIAHSVPLNMAPTLAKLRPELNELRYMSRRPARSCWRRGRSVSGIAAPPPVGLRMTDGAAEAERAGVGVEFTMPARGTEGLAAPAAVFGVGVVMGRGWDIGVS